MTVCDSQGQRFTVRAGARHLLQGTQGTRVWVLLRLGPSKDPQNPTPGPFSQSFMVCLSLCVCVGFNSSSGTWLGLSAAVRRVDLELYMRVGECTFWLSQRAGFSAIYSDAGSTAPAAAAADDRGGVDAKCKTLNPKPNALNP